MTPSETYVIGVREDGEPCTLSMWAANAKALGWADQFPTYSEWMKAEAAAGRRKLFYKRSSRIRGGRIYKLCRTPSRKGTPAGMFHQFRLSQNVKNRLIAETLQKLQVDWYWTTLPGGMRRSKEDWLAMIPATP